MRWRGGDPATIAWQVHKMDKRFEARFKEAKKFGTDIDYMDWCILQETNTRYSS